MGLNVGNMNIANYFSEHWSPDTSYEYTGDSLTDKINDLKPSCVLDVGCGFNYYRSRIHNLYGIDPYNECADRMCSIEEFGSYLKYPVVMALGSINFGGEDLIDRQMRSVNKLVKNEGHLFMRLNPGLDHHWDDNSKGIEFYPWTKEKIKHFALAYGYIIDEWEEEYNVHGSLRYYVHMIKL
jgi:hypothetical protein